MSLDVYLEMPEGVEDRSDRIYIRRDGATVEISREEWDTIYPDREPATVRANDDSGEVFWRNITHNLGRMAREAGLYEALWRPDEINATRGADLIVRLRDGLARLVSDPDHFAQFNPENGWGDYDLLVSFTADYLAACERWPGAVIQVSR